MGKNTRILFKWTTKVPKENESELFEKKKP
jgi:hypothetical protein